MSGRTPEPRRGPERPRVRRPPDGPIPGGRPSPRPAPPARPPAGERLYRLLLRAYPDHFRARYGADLLQAYRDRAQEARHAAGPAGRARLWAFLLADLARSVPRQRLGGRGAGGGGDRGGRSSPGEGAMASWARDARILARGLTRSPGFTTTVVGTLALGIGATTAMFSVLDAVLLRPLPYQDAHRLVQVGSVFGAGRIQVSSVSPPDLLDLQERARAFEALAGSRLQSMTLLAEGEPERLEAAGVSASFFRVLGVEPALGRTFREDEDGPAGAPVVVLEHGFWRSRLGGDPGVLGRTLALNGRRWTVVGVMPAGFRPPEAIHHGDVRLWFPLGLVEDDLTDRSAAFIQVIGRLAPGAGVEAGREELAAVMAGIREEHPEVGQRETWVEPLQERTVRDVGPTLHLLFGAVVFLLLIACANVANLLLVRATERAREIAVRVALGAGRGRVARQLLTESVLLSLAGGAAGVALAHGGVRVFRALSPGDLPRLAEVAVDGRVLVFALAVSLLTGVLFGLAPVLQGTRGEISGTLREGGPTATGGRSRSRLRGALVVGQTAVALVLLVGAGLLLHSLARLSRVDPGFDPEGAVWMSVALPARYESEETRLAFFRELLARVEALPGVQLAGAVHGMPLDGNQTITTTLPEGLEVAPGDEPPRVAFHEVLPGYFQALGIPLRDGRDFTGADDDAGAAPVAVVSEAFVRRYWPGERAVGRRIQFGRLQPDSPWATVVGVAADVHHYGLDRPPEPVTYVPQRSRSSMTLVARHDGGDPEGTLRAMREAVWSLDPSIPLDRFGTLRAQVSAALVEPRFYAALLGGFAALSFLLASVGLYASLAFTVRLRSREMGIRMALGAAASDVGRMVVGHGMRLAALGITLGLGGAWGLSRFLGSSLFGVSPTDLPTFAGVAAAAAFVALAACWLPGRRAAGLDPVAALRSD